MSKLQFCHAPEYQLHDLVEHAIEQGQRVPFVADLAQAEIVYNSLNHTVFAGLLVRPPICIRNYTKRQIWGECEGFFKKSRWGEPYTKVIRLERNWPNYKKFITVIAHEMVHQWEWDTLGVMTHGKTSFFIWKEPLKQHGIILNIKG